MSLTQAQADDRFILNSFGEFLNRNVKPPYDTYASSNANVEFTDDPLRVMQAGPDDPKIILTCPTIGFDYVEASNNGREFGLGSVEGWRFANFTLYCYPALTDSGEPSKAAMLKLRSIVRNAFGCEYIAVIDYGNASSTPENPVFCNDYMQITGITGPIARGNASGASTQSLNVERHRFDFVVHVRYPVIETLNT